MNAQLPESERSENQSARRRGEHGYDAALESMRALGAARGPDVRACGGMHAPPVEQVDLYALLAHLLGVRTETGHAGDLSHIRSFLKSSQFAPGPGPGLGPGHDYERYVEGSEEGTTVARERGDEDDPDSDLDYSGGGQSKPHFETRSGGPRIIAIEQSALLLGSPDADSGGAMTFAPTFIVALIGSLLLASYVLLHTPV